MLNLKTITAKSLPLLKQELFKRMVARFKIKKDSYQLYESAMVLNEFEQIEISCNNEEFDIKFVKEDVVVSFPSTIKYTKVKNNYSVLIEDVKLFLDDMENILIQ